MKIRLLIVFAIVPIILFKFLYKSDSSSSDSGERWNTKIVNTDNMKKLNASIDAAVHRRTAPDKVVSDLKTNDGVDMEVVSPFSLDGPIGNNLFDSERLNRLLLTGATGARADG